MLRPQHLEAQRRDIDARAFAEKQAPVFRFRSAAAKTLRPPGVKLPGSGASVS